MNTFQSIKKYVQFTVVVIVFVGLVALRQMLGYNTPAIQGPIAQIGTSSPTPGQTNSLQITPAPVAQGQYKNGTYTGAVADAFYGNVQIQVAVASGKISAVTFVQYPNDNGTSQYVNSQAMPMLQAETLKAQSAQVNVISGASATSGAFQQSLSSALAQAKV